MSTLGTLYKSSLGLLTDLYQLTMAYGYWKTGRHDREAVFHLFFRKHPFGGGFTVAAGLATRCRVPGGAAIRPGRPGVSGRPARKRRAAALRAGVSRLPGPDAAGVRRATASPRERSSFPTSRCCGSRARCSRPNCWKRRC